MGIREELGKQHIGCVNGKAIIHTKGLEIIKQTNEHCHPPDENSISCCEVKVSIKRKAKDSQDCSHYIVGECLDTVSDVTAAICPSLTASKGQTTSASKSPSSTSET